MNIAVSVGRFRRWLFVAAVALAAGGLLGAGCASVRPSRSGKDEIKVQKNLLESSSQKSGGVSASGLQAEVMRFADRYAGAVAQAADDFMARVPGAEARTAAYTWKIGQSTAAIVNAANPNPLINALDMVVLATLSRLVQEDYWVGKAFGEEAKPLLQTQQQLEREAWDVAAKFLKPDQQRELRELISEWHAKNPDMRYVASTRLAVFAETIGKLPEEGKARPGSIFSLFMVDPLAGLDPAARALEQTRYLAERSMFYFQRLPTLLSWQAELLTSRVTSTTEAQQWLADFQRVSQSAEVFGRTAEQLPQLINDQRQAAIDQIFQGLATERSNWVATLTTEQAGLNRSLGELRQTLEAGNAMAASLDGAIKSLDGFVGRFDKSPGEVPRTNARPFEVLDYARAAAEVAVAARELNTAIGSMDETLPRLQKAGEQGEHAVRRLMTRGFVLGALLIVLLCAGGMTAGITYRRWCDRRATLK